MALEKFFGNTMLQDAMPNVKDIGTSLSNMEDNVFAGMHMLHPLNIKKGPMKNVVVRKVLVDHGETLSTRHVVKYTSRILKNLTTFRLS